jgi:Protein of unknown function (DUF4235)
MSKLLYKPLGLMVSVAGGILAGVAFKQVWKLIGHDEPPHATDRERSWAEVLPAAALQGAVFGIVKAAVDRAAASGVERATGTWPG